MSYDRAIPIDVQQMIKPRNITHLENGVKKILMSISNNFLFEYQNIRKESGHVDFALFIYIL